MATASLTLCALFAELGSYPRSDTDSGTAAIANMCPSNTQKYIYTACTAHTIYTAVTSKLFRLDTSYSRIPTSVLPCSVATVSTVELVPAMDTLESRR